MSYDDNEDEVEEDLQFSTIVGFISCPFLFCQRNAKLNFSSITFWQFFFLMSEI